MMPNWTSKKLGDVVTTHNGAWGVEDNSGTAVLRSTNFNSNGTISWDQVAYRSIPQKKVVSLGLKPNDILIEKSGGSPAQPVGRVVFFEKKQKDNIIYGNFISKFQVKDSEIVPKYLFYYLHHFYKSGDINKYQSQTTGIRNLQLKDYLNIAVPKFAKSAQEMIVERLDAIRKSQELCDTQIQKTEELFESTRETIYSSCPKWEFKKINEIATVVMGQSPKGETYNTTGDGLPLINGPVEFGIDQLSETHITKYTNRPTKVCQKGDLILCVRGSTTGRTNIAVCEACIGRGVASIRVKGRFIQSLLNYYFASKRDYLFSIGSGSTFPNINLDQIVSLKIATPPDVVQQRIVEKLDAILESKKMLIMQKDLLKELFDSVLYKSMNGEIDN